MNRRRTTLPALAALAVLVLAACGSEPEEDASAGRTVQVEMVDIAFEPTELTFTKGETVTFEFVNNGEVDHEAFIGDTAAQADHELEMGDGGGHHGDGSDAITVEPGATETLTYTFDEAGRTEIGCHQPGHYDGGMKSDITVT